MPIGKQRGYELARTSNGGTGKKKREWLSDSNPPSQYSALNSVNGATARRFRASLACLPSSSLFAFRPSEAQSECVKASPANCSLQRREGERWDGCERCGSSIYLSLCSLSVVPGSVCECGVSQLYGPDRERERERGALARSFFKSRVE